MVGWVVCLCAFVCVRAPQQEARAMFRSVEERDTEGLFPPSRPPQHSHQQDTAGQTEQQLYAICRQIQWGPKVRDHLPIQVNS